MCVLSIKVPIQKKSGNLFIDPRMSLLRVFVACFIIPYLSYCISLAIKPFLYSTNVLTIPFYSSTTLTDCIPFKFTSYKKCKIIIRISSNW